MSDRETMTFDVVIVGAGPAGLATAIHLAQLNAKNNGNLSIAVLEKGAEVGAHIVSGCVLETHSLDQLLPNWRQQQPPTFTPVTQDRFYLLSQNHSFRMPTPPQMRNHGNIIISLSQYCRWLATQAENLGVMIIPGYAAQSLLKNESQQVIGVRTGDMGLLADGRPGPQHQAGVDIHCQQVVLAEGCRGHLSEQVMADYNLREQAQPQTYGIGVKEIWQVDPKVHQKGLVIHSVGWPMDHKTYGGSFLYHYDDHKIALGYVVGLDYENPTLDPHAELQRLKHHPLMKAYFEGGTRIGYAARALNEGGWQAMPQCYFPGGLIVGCAAGFLNVPKIKGTHNAIHSGMLAAQALYQGLKKSSDPTTIGSDYQQQINRSSIAQELKRCRNIRPGFYRGLTAGLINAAWETVTLGLSPWTLPLHDDHSALKPLNQITPIHYPKPDGIISFRKLDSVRLSNTNHAENQPCHLQLLDNNLPTEVNYPIYGGPEAYYCPAQVYEYVATGQGYRLQINSQNCVHCKTCDIKDPKQNIHWTTPQGGDGPRYSET